MAKNENLRTTGFMGFAVVSLALAGVTYWLNTPPTIDGFELVGQAFFEEFEESSQAVSLEVVALDDDAQLKKFSVKRIDGLWTIPSHHDYPAEAIDRLGATSSSVIGLEREALAGRLESEFEKFGVVDPTDPDVTDPETTGQRLTLLDEDEGVLADFIIGKQAGDAPQRPTGETIDADPLKYYYVRRADESQTYKVQLKLDLSTNFSDWIDPDLLRMEPNNLTRIFLDNYQLKERAGDLLGQTMRIEKIEGEKITLFREQAMDWQMEGLTDPTEKLNSERVDKITKVLQDLKIVDVRPKTTFMGQQVLTADLEINPDPVMRSDPRGFNEAINQLRAEMGEIGFNLLRQGQGEESRLFFYCKKGQLELGTSDGVKYTLLFGNDVSGDTNAIEVGGTESDEAESENAGEEANDASDQSEGQQDRYLMIRVQFDESLLGEAPVVPVEPKAPVAPDGYTAPEAVEKTESGDEAPVPDLEKKDQDADPQDPAPKPGQRSPVFLAHDKALQEFEDAKIDYELKLARYKDQMIAWDEKVTAGKALVRELHERFGKWYYVIKADELNLVQANRADLIEKQEVNLEPGAPLPNRPDISFDGDSVTDGDANPTKEPKKDSEDLSGEVGQQLDEDDSQKAEEAKDQEVENKDPTNDSQSKDESKKDGASNLPG